MGATIDTTQIDIKSVFVVASTHLFMWKIARVGFPRWNLPNHGFLLRPTSIYPKNNYIQNGSWEESPALHDASLIAGGTISNVLSPSRIENNREGTNQWLRIIVVSRRWEKKCSPGEQMAVMMQKSWKAHTSEDGGCKIIGFLIEWNKVPPLIIESCCLEKETSIWRQIPLEVLPWGFSVFRGADVAHSLTT